jgi:T4 RnlA family RNA ligase
MNLCNKYKEFYYSEEEVVGTVATTFNYRRPPLDLFTEYGARNLRGIAFRKDTKELLCLMLPKFWNFNENRFVEERDVKKWTPKIYTEKVDGSLIGFYTLNGELCAKTQNTSFSNQAVRSLDIVNNNPELKSIISKMIYDNQTPLFEYVSLQNQIVIPYENEELVFICSRDNDNGKLYYYNLDSEFLKNISTCRKIKTYKFNSIKDVIDICLKDRLDILIEGFVVTFDGEYGQELVKFKTKEYLLKFNVMESVLSLRSLTRLILSNNIDDVKSFYYKNKEMLDFINNTEIKVNYIKNILIQIPTNFYNENKQLIQKEYVFELKKYTNDIFDDKLIFSLTMYIYNHNGTLDDKFCNEQFIKYKCWELDIKENDN